MRFIKGPIVEIGCGSTYSSRNSRQNGPICSHRRIRSCSTILRTLHRSGICSVGRKVCNLWWSRTDEQTCNCECPGSPRSRPNLENSLWVLAEPKKFSNVLWEIKSFLILLCFMRVIYITSFYIFLYILSFFSLFSVMRTLQFSTMIYTLFSILKISCVIIVLNLICNFI